MRFLILISLIVAVFLSIYPTSAKDLQVFDYSDRSYSKKNPNQIRLHKNILTLLERAIFGKSKKRKRNRRGAVKLMLHQWKDINMETLQDFVATFPKLRWLLEQNHDIIRNYITSVASLPRRGGVTRRLRLWCRSGIGYHLEISRKGRVVARHQQSPDGLLEMVSVRTGVVAIRNSKRKYICMNRKGRLISKVRSPADCINEIHYNEIQ